MKSTRVMSIERIIRTIGTHEQHRLTTVNLLASENLLSPAARAALISDLGHRYCIPPPGQRHPAVRDYPNQTAPRSLEQAAEALACEAFGAYAADVRPLSGNNAAYILIAALLRPGQSMASVPADCGGHFATAEICHRRGIRRHDIPYDRDTATLDVDATARLSVRSRSMAARMRVRSSCCWSVM